MAFFPVGSKAEAALCKDFPYLKASLVAQWRPQAATWRILYKKVYKFIDRDQATDISPAATALFRFYYN